MICVGWYEVDGGKAQHLRGPRHRLGGHTSSCVTCVRVCCIIVSMERGVGDGKVVDGGAILSTVIFSMVASRRSYIGYGKMTSSVMVFNAITFDMVALRKEDICDDGEVTFGVMVSLRESRGDGILVYGLWYNDIRYSGLYGRKYQWW